MSNESPGGESKLVTLGITVGTIVVALALLLAGLRLLWRVRYG